MNRTFRTVLYVARIIADTLIAASTLFVHVVAADDPPNFIIVMTDDQGWGDAGDAGHPRLKTPNLDAMAANSLRFDRFCATASMCSPTRVATLTGRNNLRFGIGGPISQGEDHYMESDPHETKNIAAAHPELTRGLRRTLEAWIAECEASERGEDYVEEKEHAQ